VTAAPPPGRGCEEVLSLEAVTLWLSGREILHDVTFSLRAGELTGLIGSNGAGKTTIFRVILGLQAPSGGRVLFGGRPRPRRNRSIGYVPQSIALDPDVPLRTRDLVALGLDGDRLGIPLPSRSRRRLVDEMLDSVDATAFADARVGALSGGELQRALIAHALISEPGLLLLDEPLANLDISSEQEVVGLLADVAKRRGVAVLISAHEMNPLLPVMDRVVYVAAGRAASGSTEEVVREDVLSALYGHHVDVLHLDGRILVVAGRHEGHHAAREGQGAAAPRGLA
jgi:zinc/manganese transport system ATP-binding protein